jgi:hypothetical protein
MLTLATLRGTAVVLADPRFTPGRRGADGGAAERVKSHALR